MAATLGNLTASEVSVANIPLTSEFESAYAIYENGQLSRAGIVNMIEYNYTGATTSRPIAQYTVSFPSSYNGSVLVQRLMANGSDVLSGITFAGYSYNWELDNGLPVLLTNVTQNETLDVINGKVTVDVPYSSYALLNF